jgi:DNA-directed RNA polymerase specialized sigma24 family protein
VIEQSLARARGGDEGAFRELTDPYRRELQLHIYRMVGPDTVAAAAEGCDALVTTGAMPTGVWR